ncbi:MAG: hypothetical protein ABI134_20075, partial [Byssovorax sp.]
LQMTGDCHTIYCDGAGSTYSGIDNADVPADGNLCTVGTCTAGVGSNPPAPAGLDCGAGKKCNATGLCKKSTGQTCAAGGECLSANCFDGVCCSTTCSLTCKACNLAGSVGTCTNIPAKQPDASPAGTCVGVNYCDGMGVCKLGPGQTCTANAQCISSVCVTATGMCQ